MCWRCLLVNLRRFNALLISLRSRPWIRSLSTSLPLTEKSPLFVQVCYFLYYIMPCLPGSTELLYVKIWTTYKSVLQTGYHVNYIYRTVEVIYLQVTAKIADMQAAGKNFCRIWCLSNSFGDKTLLPFNLSPERSCFKKNTNGKSTTHL